MPDITVAEFRARFTEFSAVSDLMVTSLIEAAYELTDVSENATFYCIAHLAAIMAEETGAADGGSGVVSQETIGPRSVSYVTQAKDDRDAFFATTAYGREVLALESRSAKAAFGVVTA